eukprot:TRINITY_DN4185_c0_g2_i4.p1 TRINITY_DN4185_c0_g2~~TRINITY_DN4185_c0_g2_i4.p1  ORF type:complete len:792 (+),score=125.89 TRINITY_DN4185_c0_g2_i4:269-2644(+)
MTVEIRAYTKYDQKSANLTVSVGAYQPVPTNATLPFDCSNISSTNKSEELLALSRMYVMQFKKRYLFSLKQSSEARLVFKVGSALTGSSLTCDKAIFCSGVGDCAITLGKVKCLCPAKQVGPSCQWDTSIVSTASEAVDCFARQIWALMGKNNDYIGFLESVQNIAYVEEFVSASRIADLVNITATIIDKSDIGILFADDNNLLKLLQVVDKLMSVISLNDGLLSDEKAFLQQKIFSTLTKVVDGQAARTSSPRFFKSDGAELALIPVYSSTLGQVSSLNFSVEGANIRFPLSALEGQGKFVMRLLQLEVNPFEQANEKRLDVSPLVEVRLVSSTGRELNSFKNAVTIEVPKLLKTPVQEGSSVDYPPYSCQYYDTKTKGWLTDGCSFAGETASAVLCECVHFTTFSAVAVPDNIKNQSNLMEALVRQNDITANNALINTFVKSEGYTNFFLKSYNLLGLWISLLFGLIYIAVQIAALRKPKRYEPSEENPLTAFPLVSLVVGQPYHLLPSSHVRTTIFFFNLALQMQYSIVFLIDNINGNFWEFGAYTTLVSIGSTYCIIAPFHFVKYLLIARWEKKIDPNRLRRRLKAISAWCGIVLFVLMVGSLIAFSLRFNLITDPKYALKWLWTFLFSIFIDSVLDIIPFTIAYNLANVRVRRLLLLLRGFYDTPVELSEKSMRAQLLQAKASERNEDIKKGMDKSRSEVFVVSPGAEQPEAHEDPDEPEIPIENEEDEEDLGESIAGTDQQLPDRNSREEEIEDVRLTLRENQRREQDHEEPGNRVQLANLYEDS